MKNTNAIVLLGVTAFFAGTALLAAGCAVESEPSEPTESADPGGPTEADDEDVAEAEEALGSPTIYDGFGGYKTVCNGMHCCPIGYAMVGIHAGDNVFACRQAMVDSSHEVCTTQTTVRQGMKACLDGYYMRGANLGSNTFTCCKDVHGQAMGQEGVDYNTNDGYMHTCKPWEEQAMTGYHNGNNLLLCRSFFGLAQ